MKLLFLALLVLEVYGKFLFSVKKCVSIFIKNAFLFKTQQLEAHLEMMSKSISFLLVCLSLKKTNKLFYSSNVNTDFKFMECHYVKNSKRFIEVFIKPFAIN